MTTSKLSRRNPAACNSSTKQHEPGLQMRMRNSPRGAFFLQWRCVLPSLAIAWLGEYNVHPMWYDVRQATKKMQHGVYEDLSGRKLHQLLWRLLRQQLRHICKDKVFAPLSSPATACSHESKFQLARRWNCVASEIYSRSSRWPSLCRIWITARNMLHDAA